MFAKLKALWAWLRQFRIVGWFAGLYSWLANTEQLFPGSVTSGGVLAVMTFIWGLLTGAYGPYLFAVAIAVFCVVVLTVKLARMKAAGKSDSLSRAPQPDQSAEYPEFTG